MSAILQPRAPIIQLNQNSELKQTSTIPAGDRGKKDAE